MTKIQVDAANLRETIRHNEAVESATRDTNRINEEHYVRADTVSQAQAAEVARHNVAGEELTRQGLVINANALEETKRHNIAQEGIGVSQVGVGYAQAAAAQASAAASMLSSQAAMRNAETSALLAPSQIAYNQAHTDEATTSALRNTTQASVNSNQAALIGAQTATERLKPDLTRAQTFNQVMSGTNQASGVLKNASDATIGNASKLLGGLNRGHYTK